MIIGALTAPLTCAQYIFFRLGKEVPGPGWIWDTRTEYLALYLLVWVVGWAVFLVVSFVLVRALLARWLKANGNISRGWRSRFSQGTSTCVTYVCIAVLLTCVYSEIPGRAILTYELIDRAIEDDLYWVWDTAYSPDGSLRATVFNWAKVSPRIVAVSSSEQPFHPFVDERALRMEYDSVVLLDWTGPRDLHVTCLASDYFVLMKKDSVCGGVNVEYSFYEHVDAEIAHTATAPSGKYRARSGTLTYPEGVVTTVVVSDGIWFAEKQRWVPHDCTLHSGWKVFIATGRQPVRLAFDEKDRLTIDARACDPDAIRGVNVENRGMEITYLPPESGQETSDTSE